MSGFFSKLIGALLGEKKKKPEEKIRNFAEVKTALSSPSHVMSREGPESYEGQSTIYRMIAKAYRRIAISISEKSRDRRSVAVTGVVVAVLIVLLSYTSFFFYLRGTILAIIIIFIAALSKLTQKLIPFVVGFDLCLFFTVLFAVAYHPLAGIIVGVLSSALGSIMRGQYDMDKVIVPLLGYITVGALLMAIPATNIIYTGMLMTVIYSVMMSVIFWFIMHCVSSTMTFLITSLAFNYWLFSNYATFFLKLMGVNG